MVATAALSSSSVQLPFPDQPPNIHRNYTPCHPLLHRKINRGRPFRSISTSSCETLTLDRTTLSVEESASDDELSAAVRLRVRSFYQFGDSTYAFDGSNLSDPILIDHKRYLTERELEALKDRIAGRRKEFKMVTCINATLPLSGSLSSASDLCSVCKYSVDGEDRVVVGTLDLNQCARLADEIIGKRPEGTGADVTRAYICNVCVAKELHRNGVGYALLVKSIKVAREWGITDLYVHVAVDNEAARKLYMKSGFVYENEEPAWQARFLGRPRRYLLWADLTQTNNL
ncbi:hypothetical protein QJS04_geneDACA022872 [Acorus gramineus]|uniref:N-acetyltransferase domain-containing protein n=1 Tax=Acorus gramineus TaxID=55184 RepID=A0AAV9B195_ACOGR|nr:hypothetical protein QJS04_geneDACA022872 [Acorus gramineus]